MEELLQDFIYCIYMYGRCREHALAFTHRRICKKIAKFSQFNCNFRWRNLPMKSWVRHDMSLIKALYGKNNLCCRVNTDFGLYTSSTLRKSKNEPFTNIIPDEDINDIEELRILWHATHQELSYHIGSVFVRWKSIEKTTALNIKIYSISDAISTKISTIFKNWGYHNMLLIRGFYVI